MDQQGSFFEVWSPRILSVLRIVTAFLYVQHGTAKLFQLPHVAALDGVEFFSLIGFAAVLEIMGGVLLLIGLFTRVVAFILSGEMAVAYFIAHAPAGILPILNEGGHVLLRVLLSMGGGRRLVGSGRLPAAPVA